MIGGEPKVGYVLRYAYLWHDEFARARDESEKHRPCVLLVATGRLDPEERTIIEELD